MVRKNFMITTGHAKALAAEAKKKDVSMSEILRKALDHFFADKAQK